MKGLSPEFLRSATCGPSAADGLRKLGIGPVTGGRIEPVVESEPDFQRDVVRLAGELGWRAFHVTITKKSAAGWPDLILLRERIIAAELKVPPNATTPEQDEWLARFRQAQVETHVWTPGQWNEIGRTLA